MQEGVPSRTAFGVAYRRAAHQLLDERPPVLDDPVAVPILGPDTSAGIIANSEKHRHPFSLTMRALMVVRSRCAEDHLKRAVASGVRQYVVLGAGLDTFAYRNPFPPERLRVFEVDHPATQEWKRELLASGTGVTFEYALPREALGERGKLAFDLIASRVKKAGEPFQLFFLPEQMRNELRGVGFGKIEELSSSEINALYFAERKDGLRLYGEAARLITAWIEQLNF